MVGKRKISVRMVASVVIFLIGFLMCSYPLVSSLIEQRYQKDTVATHEKAVKESDEDTKEGILKEAENYNSMLYQTEGIVVGNINDGILSEESYNSILNLSGNGVMGSVEIPKINVNLPIYHGTSNEVLNIGVGHVKQSSLPIGGINARTILTGHRGLPNSKLFTRLDEMVVGDLFFIRVLDDTLAYQVCDIEVIEPDEVEKLGIKEGRDLATLLTCTPYGINTHRLIITGERVEYQKAEYEAIESEVMSPRELIFTIIPFAFLTGFVVVLVVSKRRSKKGVERDEVKEV